MVLSETETILDNNRSSKRVGEIQKKKRLLNFYPTTTTLSLYRIKRVADSIARLRLLQFGLQAPQNASFAEVVQRGCRTEESHHGHVVKDGQVCGSTQASCEAAEVSAVQKNAVNDSVLSSRCTVGAESLALRDPLVRSFSKRGFELSYTLDHTSGIAGTAVLSEIPFACLERESCNRSSRMRL